MVITKDQSIEKIPSIAERLLASFLVLGDAAKRTSDAMAEASTLMLSLSRCPFCRVDRLVHANGRCSSIRCARIARRLGAARERQRFGQRPHAGGGWFGNGRGG